LPSVIDLSPLYGLAEYKLNQFAPVGGRIEGLIGLTQLNSQLVPQQLEENMEKKQGWILERPNSFRIERMRIASASVKFFSLAKSQGWTEEFTVQQISLYLSGERGDLMHDETLSYFSNQGIR